MSALSVPRGGASRWGVLTLCAVAQFMVVLDVSIVNVALPQMRHDLGLSLTSQQWVVNAYTLTFAGVLMLGGRAADLFGRRRVFLVGLSLFTLASLAGGLAQSGTWLVTARAAQGLGGAVLAPSSLSLLTSTFTDMGERRRAMGVWSATAASGAAAGVLAGGILTDLLDWRWVLFVNVPIGLVMLITAPRVLTESQVPGARRLDLEGAFTITAGLALVVYGIVGTDTHPWASTQTVMALVGGFAFLVAALFVEARVAADPLVPLSVFRRRSLCAANGIAMALGAALFGMYFFVSLYLQEVMGYSPLRTGLSILPAGVMTLLGALAAPRVVARIGARRQLMLGPAVAAAGLLWMSSLAYGDDYWAHMLVPLMLFGLGVGTTFVPMTLTATAGLPPSEAGLAAGLVNTSRQIGGAVGLAVLATIAAGATRGTHAAGVLHAQAALIAGYDRAFLVAGLLLLAGAGLASFVRSAATAPNPAVSEETKATQAPTVPDFSAVPVQAER